MSADDHEPSTIESTGGAVRRRPRSLLTDASLAYVSGASPGTPLMSEEDVPFDLTPEALPPGVSLMPEKPRKIAIVGYTISNRQAPYDSPDWHVMGMNNMHTVIQNTRWDSWIDVHDKRTLAADAQHQAWLRELHTFPVYMNEPSPEYPSSRPFPRAELVERFGDYFTNTVAWQVAWAITQVEWAIGDGAEIGIWGVDMAQGSEYAQQRPSCEYHVGIARGMGIKVTVAETSDLLKSAAPYGSTEGKAMRGKLGERVFELEERIAHVRREQAQAQGQLQSLRDAENQMLGALEQARYLLGTWFPPEVGPGATRAPNDLRALAKGA